LTVPHCAAYVHEQPILFHKLEASVFWKIVLRSGGSARVSLSLVLLTMIAVLSLAGCGTPAPVSVAATASASTVDSTDSVNLTATVAHDKNAAGVGWTVSGGGTLSSTTTSSVTYTAPPATASAKTITVTATSVADATKSFPVTLTVPAAPSITNSSLTGANVGVAYSATLTGSGGVSPYKWSVNSGTLPAWASLNAATGAITGTPHAADGTTTNLTFKLTDSGTATALSSTKALSLTVNAAPAITFSGSVPATATYNVAYTGSATASGGAGALTYSKSGTWPAWLSLNTSTGAVSGTPNAVGTFPFSVTAADAFGDTNTQGYSVVVTYPTLKVTAATLPAGYVGTNYTSTTLAATGGSGAGYTWTSTSALPAGLVLSAAGVITGKPTATGTTSFTVKVTDSASNSGTGTFSITINAAVSITTATTLPTGYVGSNYSQTLAATGGSGTGFSWAFATGSTPPAGLNLSAAGVLSGKPTTTGAPSFSITVTDSLSNTATATFSMTILAAISITTAPTLPAGYQGTVYPGATMAATGGTGTGYTWSWSPAGGSSLPAGLSLSTGGAISGTPTAAGTFNVTITVADSASNTASASFSLTVQATLAIATASPLKTGTVSVAYSQQLAATGGTGTGYTWSTDVAGTSSLSAIGLTFSPAGLVAGASPTLGTATFTAKVADSGSHTASLAFTVSVTNALAITTANLPAAYTGKAYSQTLAAAGGSGTGYTFSVSGTSNLATFNLSLSGTGVVSGTPATTGTASFTAKVTDSLNNTATALLTIPVYNTMTLTPAGALAAGTVGQSYSAALTAAGGSGTYNWTVAGLSDGLNYSSNAGVLTISGIPTTATTVTFTASVTDPGTGITLGPNTYTILVNNAPPPVLPAANPTSLGSATVNQSYTGTISATGGVPGYTFSINGTTVPTNGTALTLSNGLSATNTGGNTLTISGTPTATGTVTITSVTVKDSTNATSNAVSYTIAVNSAGSQVSGQIFLSSGCQTGGSLPTITVSINTTPVQTTTTDNNGNYSFASVPNGTYTITPSISGVSSVFYPATMTNVVVNNNPASGENFSAALGFSVKGTVSYAGSRSGRVYLNLQGSCGGGGGTGTSLPFSALSSGGAFTINGVPPGNYTLNAYIDNLGEGAPNASNPTGSSASVPVTTTNVTGVSVSLADPTITAPTSAPNIQAIQPTNLGVVISFKPLTNNGVESVTSYNLQWSTSSTFASGISTISLAAAGTNSNVWFLDNNTAGISGSFTNGTAYYFRVQGSDSAGVGPWGVFGSPTAVTIGAPSGAGYFTVSGTVTIPSSVTPTGPLYAGLFDQSKNVAYAVRIGSPVNTSGGNTYTVNVPAGSNYFLFGILDQNNNGLIDAGDVSNTDNNGSNSTLIVSGNLTGQNVALPATDIAAIVQTQYQVDFFWNGTSSQTSTLYQLNFDLREGNKLPVAVQLASASNPNVVTPVDIGNLCQGCGHPQFQLYDQIGMDVPVVNDSYTFNVTYSDGTTGTAVGKVTSVLGASALVTNLAPQQTNSASTTPTFTWTYPANASSYIYSFYICCDNNGTIWQIPGNNSNINGFPSTVTQIVWGTDPTGDTSNTPNTSSLTSGTVYQWSIQSSDTNGNSASQTVWYQP
jgi:hypothetical protein